MSNQLPKSSRREQKAIERKDWAAMRKWTGLFDARQIDEICLSMQYYNDYGHGTDGHNAKSVIAKMALILDGYEARIRSDIGEGYVRSDLALMQAMMEKIP